MLTAAKWKRAISGTPVDEVILEDFVDRWQEIDRMVPVVTDIVEETGAVIHPMPYPEEFYRERATLMREVRGDGVDL